MPATAISQPGSVQRDSQGAARASRFNSSPEQAETSSHEDIARLAYALWQSRGCPEGSPEADWLAAEEQLQYQADTQGRSNSKANT
jgi:hypothetical protein